MSELTTATEMTYTDDAVLAGRDDGAAGLKKAKLSGLATYVFSKLFPSLVGKEAFLLRVNSTEDGIEWHEPAISDASDVDTTGVADLDVLTYDNATSTWKPAAPASGGAVVLDDLTDVNAPSPADGDALIWDSATSKWIPDVVGSGITTASRTEVLTGTDTAKAATSDSVSALWEKAADVASSGTISFGEGGYFFITGTTTITDMDFATDKAGRKVWIKFDGILTLTHSSTLILPTAANVVTAAGDTACFISEGSDVVRCICYQRASGAALTGSGGGSAALYPIDGSLPTFTTWVNQGSTTLTTESDGSYSIFHPKGDTSENVRGKFMAVPSTPYSITVGLHGGHSYINYQFCGIAWRDSASGKMVIVGCYADGGTWYWISMNYNSPTSKNANVTLISSPHGFTAPAYIKFGDDGTTRTAFGGFNRKIQQVAFYSAGHTSFLTADQIGIVTFNQNTTCDFGFDLFRWD